MKTNDSLNWQQRENLCEFMHQNSKARNLKRGNLPVTKGLLGHFTTAELITHSLVYLKSRDVSTSLFQSPYTVFEVS